MGVGYNFLCCDCREYMQIGYGPYSTWLYATTIADYEKLSPELKDLGKNQILESLLREHDKHQFYVLNMDSTVERDNKIYDENCSPNATEPYELIADITNFKRIKP